MLVNGMYFNPRSEKAPDFVKGGISIHVERFAEWLNENSKIANEKGYIKISLKISKAGNPCAIVDTYEPKKQDEDEF